MGLLGQGNAGGLRSLSRIPGRYHTLREARVSSARALFLAPDRQEFEQLADARVAILR